MDRQIDMKLLNDLWDDMNMNTKYGTGRFPKRFDLNSFRNIIGVSINYRPIKYKMLKSVAIPYFYVVLFPLVNLGVEHWLLASITNRDEEWNLTLRSHSEGQDEYDNFENAYE